MFSSRLHQHQVMGGFNSQTKYTKRVNCFLNLEEKYYNHRAFNEILGPSKFTEHIPTILTIIAGFEYKETAVLCDSNTRTKKRNHVKIDTSRQQCVLYKNGADMDNTYHVVNNMILYLVELYYTRLTILDKDNIRIKIVKTVRVGMAEVEHFEYSTFCNKSVMCSNSKKTKRTFDSNITIVLQLEGESNYIINNSCLDYIKKFINDGKHFYICHLSSLVCISDKSTATGSPKQQLISEVLKGYNVPICYIRESLTLKAGDSFVFWDMFQCVRVLLLI